MEVLNGKDLNTTISIEEACLTVLDYIDGQDQNTDGIRPGFSDPPDTGEELDLLT